MSHGSQELTCIFVKPASNGEPITGYSVQWKLANDADGTWKLASNDISPNATNYTVADSDLQPNTLYVVQVQAFNVLGWSQWSDSSSNWRTPASVSPSLPVVGHP